MSREELLQRWGTRRDEYQRLGVHVEGAKIVEAFLSDLDDLEREQMDELLTLPRAARISGYNPESLGRLVLQDKIPNAGRKGKPLIRRGDLPRKPTKPLASQSDQAYDPDADARALLGRLGGR